MANPMVKIKGFFKITKSSNNIHPGIVQMAEKDIKRYPRSTGEWSTFGRVIKLTDFDYGPKFLWQIKEIRPDGLAAVSIMER